MCAFLIVFINYIPLPFEYLEKQYFEEKKIVNYLKDLEKVKV